MSTLKQTEEQLKSRGFWQVRFVPTTRRPELISPIGRCVEIVSQASVRTRGWDYPHIPTKDDEHETRFRVMGEYVESWINWGMYKEICRFYQNGQFLHLYPVYEDWYAEDEHTRPYRQYKDITPGVLIDPIQIIYRITEVYLFLQNLASQDIYQSHLDVEISLHNTADRVLAFINASRHLSGNYQCHKQVVKIPVRRVTPAEISTEAVSLAAESIIHVLHQFQWTGVSPSLIEEEQKKLIERRTGLG